MLALAFLGHTVVGLASSGAAMCHASMSVVIEPCADGACNPAAIEIGDTVTFQVCVENLSFKIPGSTSTSPVSARLHSCNRKECGCGGKPDMDFKDLGDADTLADCEARLAVLRVDCTFLWNSASRTGMQVR